MFTSRRIATTSGDKFRDEFCLNFDGADDMIDLGSISGDLRLSGSNGAIITWIKPKLTGDEYQRIIDKSDGGNGANGYALFIKKDGNVTGNISGAAKVVTPAGDIVADKWQHLVWTWNGTTHYVYVNGVEVQSSSNSSTPPSATTNMRIGSWNHDVAREYKGKISEVAIYNTSLTASQVKTIYNGREPYNHNEGIAPSNLKGWWRMGDGIFDHKATTDAQGGVVCDMSNATLGSDIFGGRGNFTDNSDSYWSFAGAGASNGAIEDGVCKFNASGTNNCTLTKAGVLTLNQMYRLDIDVTSVDSTAAGGTSLVVDDGNPYIRVCETTDGIKSHTMYWVPKTNTTFKLYRYNATDDGEAYDEPIQFDNLKVRPVNGTPGYLENMNPNDFEGDAP